MLPLLVGRGLRVGYLKHSHKDFEIDQPGKDSYLIRRTGVAQTMIAGGGQVAVIDDAEADPALEAIVERYARDDLDVLVVEGFKRSALPKIEVARSAVSRELVCGEDPQLIAVVSDFEPTSRVRRFALDDAEGVATLITSRVDRPGRP